MAFSSTAEPFSLSFSVLGQGSCRQCPKNKTFVSNILSHFLRPFKALETAKISHLLSHYLIVKENSLRIFAFSNIFNDITLLRTDIYADYLFGIALLILDFIKLLLKSYYLYYTPISYFLQEQIYRIFTLICPDFMCERKKSPRSLGAIVLFSH